MQFDVRLERVSVTKTITRSERVTREVMRRFQAMIDQGSNIPRGGGGPWYAAEYADSMPAFGDLVMGQDGRLWVQDPIRPGSHPLVWTAYWNGEAVARLEIPPRFFPFEFGADWVLGVAYHDLDVEQVQLWRLVPGALSGQIITPRDGAPPATGCGAWRSR